MLATSWSWLTPSSAATSICETFVSSGMNSCCAWASVRPANVTGPRLSSSPNLTMPTMSSSTGSGVSSVDRVADLQVAVVGCLLVDHDLTGRLGRATLGDVPGVESRVGGPAPGERRGSVPAERIAVLADELPSPLDLRLPPRPHRRRRRSRSPSDSSISPRVSVWSLPTSMVLRTTASVPRFASENRSEKPARIVSPSTSVPARNATPSRTAKTVPNRRRLCAHTPLRLTLSIGARLPSRVDVSAGGDSQPTKLSADAAPVGPARPGPACLAESPTISSGPADRPMRRYGQIGKRRG